MTAKRKKQQIEYIEILIYIGNRILLLLKSTMPETDEILRILKSDYKLTDFDFTLNSSKYLLNKSDNSKLVNLFESIGKYDVDSQILIADEFVGYFKLQKNKYQDYYNEHYKLYILFGLFGGIIVSLVLI
jgi:hypothetical protein